MNHTLLDLEFVADSLANHSVQISFAWPNRETSNLSQSSAHAFAITSNDLNLYELNGLNTPLREQIETKDYMTFIIALKCQVFIQRMIYVEIKQIETFFSTYMSSNMSWEYYCEDKFARYLRASGIPPDWFARYLLTLWAS